MIDKREPLRRNPHHNRNVARGLKKSVRLSFMVDSQRRAKENSKDIRECLETSAGETDSHGAYAILKHWYWHASVRAPNPSRTNMEKFRGDFQTLYQSEEPHPPGIPLATHMDPVQLNDETPSEAEVEAAVRRVCPLKAGKHTHLCSENFKQWLREAYPGDNSKTPHGLSSGCVWWTLSNTCGARGRPCSHCLKILRAEVGVFACLKGAYATNRCLHLRL